jgi:hypothetical protein
MSSFFGEENKVKIEAGTSNMEFSGNGAEEQKSELPTDIRFNSLMREMEALMARNQELVKIIQENWIKRIKRPTAMETRMEEFLSSSFRRRLARQEDSVMGWISRAPSCPSPSSTGRKSTLVWVRTSESGAKILLNNW